MTTDEFDKAHSVLQLLREACSTAIDLLQLPPNLSLDQTTLHTRPACSILNKDFQSLLTLIYTSTTKVALVLRPSDASPSAAIAPISDLTASITSLATCATLFDLHGKTIASEARLLARDTCDAVRAFASIFVDNTGEDYLVRTGAVHDLVESARRELSSDNIAAIKKRWKADRGMIDDCAQEIEGMLENDGGDAGSDEALDEDGIDDEWDGLGLGSSNARLSDAEIERVKLVRPLVRFVTLFHKRVAPDVLGHVVASSTAGAGADARNAALDRLPPLSHNVLLALEEVVATLYAPQKPDLLATAVIALVAAVHRMHEVITADVLIGPPQPQADLSREMGRLRIDGAKSGDASPGGGGEKKEKEKDARKWFGGCLAQIDKSAKELQEILATQVAV